MATVLRRFADVTPVPWRNGRGTTVELIDEPRAETLTPGRPWRLSVARLTEPGPFSVFPGRYRTLIPWGGGIDLRIGGDRRHVSAGEAVHFSGAADTWVVALAAPCDAINLMASDPRASLFVAREGQRFDDDVIALALGTSAEAGHFDVLALAAGEALPSPGVVIQP